MITTFFLLWVVLLESLLKDLVGPETMTVLVRTELWEGHMAPVLFFKALLKLILVMGMHMQTFISNLQPEHRIPTLEDMGRENKAVRFPIFPCSPIDTPFCHLRNLSSSGQLIGYHIPSPRNVFCSNLYTPKAIPMQNPPCHHAQDWRFCLSLAIDVGHHCWIMSSLGFICV